MNRRNFLKLVVAAPAAVVVGAQMPIGIAPKHYSLSLVFRDAGEEMMEQFCLGLQQGAENHRIVFAIDDQATPSILSVAESLRALQA